MASPDSGGYLINLLLLTQDYHLFVGVMETHAYQIAWTLSVLHQVAAVNFSSNRLPARVDMLLNSVLSPAIS